MSEKNETAACNLCQFWSDNADGGECGSCHRFPPVATSDGGFQFPQTHKLFKCGEFGEGHFDNW